MKINNNQYWILIGIIFLFVIINGFLVLKLIKNEVQFDYTCPIPKEDVNFCDCVYSSLPPYDLRYCICYGGEKFDITSSFLEDIKNGAK